MEPLLAKGFHVAGLENGGCSYASPVDSELFRRFYERLIKQYQLNRRTRLILQSNGGLTGYGFAFRHPKEVDRIFGIFPAIDFTSWPGLGHNGLPQYESDRVALHRKYNLTIEQLKARDKELNPINNLEPMAKAGVKIYHLSGDKDPFVPLDRNSGELMKRYSALGGQVELEIVKGAGHEVPGSDRGVEFLTEW